MKKIKMEEGLTFEELYFLGKWMHAKYIDYQYITAMQDIQKRYAYHEQMALKNLMERGLIDEDFSGNIEIEDELREALHPVFFGGTVGCVRAERRLDGGTVELWNVHRCGKAVTMLEFRSEVDLLWTYHDLQENTDAYMRKKLYGTKADLRCSKVGVGYREMKYRSETDLEPAIRFLKGEW